MVAAHIGRFHVANKERSESSSAVFNTWNVIVIIHLPWYVVSITCSVYNIDCSYLCFCTTHIYFMVITYLLNVIYNHRYEKCILYFRINVSHCRFVQIFIDRNVCWKLALVHDGSHLLKGNFSGDRLLRAHFNVGVNVCQLALGNVFSCTSMLKVEPFTGPFVKHLPSQS